METKNKYEISEGEEFGDLMNQKGGEQQVIIIVYSQISNILNRWLCN